MVLGGSQLLQHHVKQQSRCFTLRGREKEGERERERERGTHGKSGFVHVEDRKGHPMTSTKQ